MELFKDTSFDFLGRKWWFILPSLILILAGLVSLIANGGPRYSIDFLGGAVMDVHWNGKPPIDRIRAAVSSRLRGASVVAAHDVTGSSEVLVSAPAPSQDDLPALRQTIDQTLSSVGAGYSIRSFEVIGPQIGADLRRQALLATGGASGGMLLYLARRFRLVYGVAAVAGMAHDAFITVGLFSLLHQEVSLTVVAALLTLIGYSMNDTIVVFDRIRENRRTSRREPLDHIINRSINQTLSRTVLTSGPDVADGPFATASWRPGAARILTRSGDRDRCGHILFDLHRQPDSARVGANSRETQPPAARTFRRRCAMNPRLLRRSLFVLAIVLAAAFAIVRSPVHLGLDLRGGASLIVRVTVDDMPPAQRREVVEQTRQILERRINAYGLSETPVQPYGSRGNELLVQLPGVSDFSRIRNMLQSRAVLEWYSVEDGPYANADDAYGAARRLPAVQPEIACPRARNRGRPARLVRAGRQPIIHGTDLRDARVGGHHGAAGHHLHTEPGRGQALRAIHAGAHRPAFRDRARPGDSQRSGD